MTTSALAERSWAVPLYHVARSQHFVDEVAALQPQDERLSEVLRAVVDALSRNPLVGTLVAANGKSVRMIVGHPLRAMPIRFFYTYDGGSQVELVRAIPIKM